MKQFSLCPRSPQTASAPARSPRPLLRRLLACKLAGLAALLAGSGPGDAQAGRNTLVIDDGNGIVRTNNVSYRYASAGNNLISLNLTGPCDVTILDGNNNDNDTFRITTSTGADTFSISDGPGNDSYTLAAREGSDQASVADGAGDDRYNLDGGAGTDTLTITDSVVADNDSPTILNWENVSGLFQ